MKKYSNKKKTQGEIFGVALMFVIIIVGIIVYAQFKQLNPNDDVISKREGKYKILAEGVLNTVVISTTNKCTIEGENTLKNLINTCLQNTYGNTDKLFRCDDGTTTIEVCKESITMLNETLRKIFSDDVIGEIPFFLTIEVPANDKSILHNVNLTNLGDISDSEGTISLDNYRKKNYKRAPSGLKTWATAQRNINMELYLYYR